MKKISLIIYIIMILSAILLVVSFWIPFISAGDDLQYEINHHSGDYLLYWDDDLSIEYDYMEYLSPQKCCAISSTVHKITHRVNNEIKKIDKNYIISDSDIALADPFDYCTSLFIFTFIFSLFTALFVLLKKYVPSIVFSIITLILVSYTALSMLSYFDSYEQSFGIFTYEISLTVILGCSICQIVLRSKINKTQPIITNSQSQIQNLDNSWICPNCNKITSGNFCNICGYKRVVNDSKKFCPECGKNLPVDADFCTNCGKKF